MQACLSATEVGFDPDRLACNCVQNRLSAAVCQQRKLSNEVVHLFSEGGPAEFVLTNCAALEPDAMATVVKDVATPR